MSATETVQPSGGGGEGGAGGGGRGGCEGLGGSSGLGALGYGGEEEGGEGDKRAIDEGKVGAALGAANVIMDGAFDGHLDGAAEGTVDGNNCDMEDGADKGDADATALGVLLGMVDSK